MRAWDGYPYCGHAVVLGSNKNDRQDTEYILRLFGKRVGSAGSKYCEFVRSGIEKGKRPDLIGGGLLRSQDGWSALIHHQLSGRLGFRTFGTHLIGFWSGYPLKNVMAVSCDPKFAETSRHVSPSEHTCASGRKIMP
jgi:hypothetical protein